MSKKDASVLAINDLALIGRSSLSAALPIINSFGVRCTPLPTALFSMQTEFPTFHKHVLSTEMHEALSDWESHSVKFDQIYSGFLADIDQVEIVEKLVKQYEIPLLLDPVMGDGGAFYPGFDQQFAVKMQSLVACAQVTTPNLTEAFFLTGMAYRAHPTQKTLKFLLNRLQKLGAQQIVLTGVEFSAKESGCLILDKNGLQEIRHPRFLGNYSGTGDVFSSVLSAKLVLGSSLFEAVQTAVDFVTECLQEMGDVSENNKRFGLPFEKILGRRNSDEK